MFAQSIRKAVERAAISSRGSFWKSDFILSNGAPYQESKSIGAQHITEKLFYRNLLRNAYKLISDGNPMAGLELLEKQTTKRNPYLHETCILISNVCFYLGLYGKSLGFSHIAKSLKLTSFEANMQIRKAEQQILISSGVSSEMKIKAYAFDDTQKNLMQTQSSSELRKHLEALAKKNIFNDFVHFISEYKKLFPTEKSILDVSEVYDEVSESFAGCKTREEPFYIEAVYPFLYLARFNLEAGTPIHHELPIAFSPLLGNTIPEVFPACFHCLREWAGYPNYSSTYRCPLYPETCPFIFCSRECFLRNVVVHRQECLFISTYLFPLVEETGLQATFILLVYRVLTRAYLENKNKSNFEEEKDISFLFRSHHGHCKKLLNQIPDLWKKIERLSTALNLYVPGELRCAVKQYKMEDLISTVYCNSVPVKYYKSSLLEVVFQTVVITTNLMEKFMYVLSKQYPRTRA